MKRRHETRPPRAFLGRGWRFPIGIDRSSGRIAAASGVEDIEQAIRVLIATAPGERVMRPELGCGAHDLVFGAVDASTIARLEEHVRNTLVRYEARIVVDQVRVRAVDGAVRGELEIRIEYRVAATNREGNLVFPFYLEERP